MTFNLNNLTVIYPEQLWIELSPQEQEKAWQISANHPYSNAAARWTAFVNYLCLSIFLNWLQEDPDLQETFGVWPQESDLPSFWEVVNGTALTLGTTRLVLIPSDKSNLSEFQIPQEWVDIPNWAANYYLAVQLNLEENWLGVWGYATYQQIQEEARYEPMTRTYSLDKEDLIEDLNIISVAMELCPPRKPEVKPLPTLSPEQAETLLNQLGYWTPYSPRLDVPFEQWAALMASDFYRQELHRRRLENLQGTTVEHSQSLVNNLSQWFQNIFEVGWQSLDALVSPQQMTPAYRGDSYSVLNKVSVKGTKLIDLGMQLSDTTVVLLVGLTSEADNKVSVRVQLHPTFGETYLPPDLRLVLLSQSGKTLQEVLSRTHDNYIQLKRFTSPPGKPFSIQVVLGDFSIKEDFVFQPLVSL